MDSKQENSKYFLITVTVLSIAYVAFGLFMALTNEFKESRNYLKKKEQKPITDEGKGIITKPISSEGKGIIIKNEGFETIEETKCKCQGN